MAEEIEIFGAKSIAAEVRRPLREVYALLASRMLDADRIDAGAGVVIWKSTRSRLARSMKNRRQLVAA